LCSEFQNISAQIGKCQDKYFEGLIAQVIFFLRIYYKYFKIILFSLFYLKASLMKKYKKIGRKNKKRFFNKKRNRNNDF